MIKAIKDGGIGEYASTELAEANGAEIISDGNKVFALLTSQGAVEWGQASEMPSGASSEDNPDFEFGKIPDGEGGWIDSPALEPTEKQVSTTRFKNSLLGLHIYGGLRVARLGLQAKFQSGTASVEEVGQLTLLEAADGMINGDTINLLDPAVPMVLDFAVANPHLSFTADDKARVLSNTPIDVAS